MFERASSPEIAIAWARLVGLSMLEMNACDEEFGET